MDDRTYTADAEPGDTVTVAGWVHEVRDLGGIAFLILRDTTGKIQVKFEKDEMDEDLVETGLNVQRESVIAVTGDVEEEPRAPTGVEITPDSVDVISEADPELPLDPSGKVDAELSTRLDNRTLDLRKDETKAIFQIRAEVLRAVREEFREIGCTEINTPKIVATGTEGGTGSFPITYFGQEAFMNQSPQLFKRSRWSAPALSESSKSVRSSAPRSTTRRGTSTRPPASTSSRPLPTTRTPWTPASPSSAPPTRPSRANCQEQPKPWTWPTSSRPRRQLPPPHLRGGHRAHQRHRRTRRAARLGRRPPDRGRARARPGRRRALLHHRLAQRDQAVLHHGQGRRRLHRLRHDAPLDGTGLGRRTRTPLRRTRRRLRTAGARPRGLRLLHQDVQSTACRPTPAGDWAASASS